jgi:hypothetical protein
MINTEFFDEGDVPGGLRNTNGTGQDGSAAARNANGTGQDGSAAARNANGTGPDGSAAARTSAIVSQVVDVLPSGAGRETEQLEVPGESTELLDMGQPGNSSAVAQAVNSSGGHAISISQRSAAGKFLDQFPEELRVRLVEVQVLDIETLSSLKDVDIIEICRSNFMFRTLLRKAVANAETFVNSAKTKFLSALPAERPSDVNFWLSNASLSGIIKDPTTFTELGNVKDSCALINQSAKWMLGVIASLTLRKIPVSPTMACFHVIRLTELLADPTNGLLRAKSLEDSLRKSLQSKDCRELPRLITVPEPSVLLQASSKQFQRSNLSKNGPSAQKIGVCYSFEKKGFCSRGPGCQFLHQPRNDKESGQLKTVKDMQPAQGSSDREGKRPKVDQSDKVKEEWSW